MLRTVSKHVVMPRLPAMAAPALTRSVVVQVQGSMAQAGSQLNILVRRKKVGRRLQAGKRYTKPTLRRQKNKSNAEFLGALTEVKKELNLIVRKEVRRDLGF